MAEVRRSTLEQAASLITGDRADSYGNFTLEAQRLGKAWAAILGQSTDLPPHTVAAMLVTFKMIRASNPTGPARLDNWIDSAGYSALGAQVDVDTRNAR